MRESVQTSPGLARCWTWPLVLGCAAAALTAGARAARAQISSLRVEPQTIRLLGDAATQRILVLANGRDGFERDVTAEAAISVADEAVAQVEGGRVLALSDGKTKINILAGGRELSIPVEVVDVSSKPAITFTQQILPVLTKRGCNAGDCHGGVKGRGGLKLSLNGLDPRDDYKWIVEGGVYQVLTTAPKEPIQPRVNLQDASKSLLLSKPSMEIAHGGGMLLERGANDYQTVLEWIEHGAPYGDEPGPDDTIVRVDVFPELLVLDSRGKGRVVVTAHLADGRRKDLSDQVRYESANREVFQVAEDGLVEAVGFGEASLLIHAARQFAHAQVAVIPEPREAAHSLPERNYIDREIFAKLRKLRVAPSEVSSDEEFLRRVCLDLTGTLPPPKRVREFLASEDPGKRDRLIEVLLNSPEFIDLWTMRLSDILRVGHGMATGADQYMYWQWIRGSVANGRPYDQIARERIASEGFSPNSRRYTDSAKVPPLERNMAELMRVFLGRRLDCAQCHNHPTETWTQQQFWGLTAFFGRLTATDWISNQVIYDDPNGQEVDQGAAGSKDVKFVNVLNPRTKEETAPTFPDGKLLPEDERADPRKALAEWMTAHRWFAEAAANRIWGYFFARGIVDPVDDFRATNPATHPALLQALADDFKEQGYDLRGLMRRIVQSTTYQLSSLPNDTNRHDVVNYSHALPRPMEAEVLLDAVSAVTGSPEKFGSQPLGTRAIELMVPGNAGSQFLEVYGAPLRAAVDERDNRENLRQALHMLVGETYTKKLAQPSGRIDRLLSEDRSDREIIEEFYLAALTRFPTPEETRTLEEGVAASESRRRGLEDLAWALLSTREFVDNH